jgi:mono/diheme cytochrome c family protein
MMKTLHLRIRTCAFLAVLVALMAVVAGCGSDDGGGAKPTSTPLPRFAQDASPTVPAVLVTAVATKTPQGEVSEAPTINPTAVARGQTNWERLECATCHGANGEGGAGQIDGVTAPPLVDLALTEDAFIDWMRSGGSLGSAHQYSTDRLSDSGGRNLYQYILSLGQ